jgi:hypothetical protein
VEISVKHLLELRNALKVLDGQPSEDGKRVVPYQFSGGVRLRLARLFRAVKDAAEPVDTTMDNLVRTHAKGADQVSAEDMPAYLADLTELYQQKTELATAISFTESELALDTNAIPVSVLGVLSDFVVG